MAPKTEAVGKTYAPVTYAVGREKVREFASAVGEENETHEVQGLFVVDGSVFPTASGVNPMLTIYGIANRAAKKIAARLS